MLWYFRPELPMDSRTLKKAPYFFVPFLLLAVSLLYYILFFAKAQVALDIEVEQNSWFKIYWSHAGAPFSESEMVRVRLQPGKTHYRFPFINLASIDRLRIDTHDYKGRAVLHSLTLKQKNFQAITVSPDSDFSQLQPLFQIRKMQIANGSLQIVSSGNDPNFLLKPRLQPAEFSINEELVRVALLCALVYLCYISFGFLAKDFRYVPICMAAVLLLAVTMALVSKQNVHPDEYVHVHAVQYYKTNWLPPKVDDESIRGSYSPYGVSRLNSDEIYYFFAGKFAKVAEPLCLNSYICARSFGIFLLLLMTIATLRVPECRVFALPLLISPQIWYVFSYCNSDGFALAAAFFAGCQVVRSQSLLNRFLRGEVQHFALAGSLLFGCCFGLLLLLKHNYLPFVLFILISAFIYNFYKRERPEKKAFLLRLAAVVVIGMVVFGLKKGADHLVNGPERGELIKQVVVETASKELSPYTPLDSQLSTLHMKDRGVTLNEIIVKYYWPLKTFNSAFGVYGYFNLSGNHMYYFLVKWSALLLLGYVLAVSFIQGGVESRLIGAAVILLSFALIGASLNHSWVADFQPQGRYLFPIASMFGVLCGVNRENLSERWAGLLTFWMFLLSVYSFIVIGLHFIPRTPCL